MSGVKGIITLNGGVLDIHKSHLIPNARRGSAAGYHTCIYPTQSFLTNLVLSLTTFFA